MQEKDLHYLITRIINPYLNWVIIELRSGNRIVYGRDGYTGLKWTDHTMGDFLASELEEWRNELWYKYRDNFFERGHEIIDSLLDIMVRIEAKLPDSETKERVIKDLWEMAEKIGDYLEIREYVDSKRPEVESKAAEIKRKDEELKKKMTKETHEYRDEKTIVLSLEENQPMSNTYKPAVSGSSKSSNGRRKFSWKNFVAFSLAVLLLFALWDLAHNDGAIISRVLPDGNERVLEPSGGSDGSSQTVSPSFFNGSNTSKDGSAIDEHKAESSSHDADNDGLDDNVEISQTGTDPLNPDTDGDGLSDGEEVLEYNTNPLVNDTDGDGLTDRAEVTTYHSDPLNADSDGDYLPDGYEVKIGTDPTSDWRYGSIDKETLKAGLSKLLRKRIRGISEQFWEYNSTLDRTWAILQWIDENIQYNDTKAEYVDKSVEMWDYLSSYNREYYANLTRLQAVNDTVFRYKSGICGDYALLTAALLLEANVSPIYVLSIDYVDQEVGHATVAVKLEKVYFVLDQHLPMIPLGNYYWFSIWGGLGEISNVTFYRVALNENGEVDIRNWTWRSGSLKKRAYKFTSQDVEVVLNLTKEIFTELYPVYQEDQRLKRNAEADLESIKQRNESARTLLPVGFHKGWTLWSSSLGFQLYYHPLLAEKLVRYYWPGPVFSDEDWVELIRECDRYYLLVDSDEYNTVLIQDSEGDSYEINRMVMVLQIAT